MSPHEEQDRYLACRVIVAAGVLVDAYKIGDRLNETSAMAALVTAVDDARQFAAYDENSKEKP